MSAKRHGIIVGSLLGIAVMSALAGGVVGHRLGRQAMSARSDPETWHERATRRFEQVVKPSPEQSRKLEVHLEAALAELRMVRREAIERSTAAIERLVIAVEAELTPAQRSDFESMKPRRGEMNLEVLDLERANPAQRP